MTEMQGRGSRVGNLDATCAAGDASRGPTGSQSTHAQVVGISANMCDAGQLGALNRPITPDKVIGRIRAGHLRSAGGRRARTRPAGLLPRRSRTEDAASNGFRLMGDGSSRPAGGPQLW
jgi:hypothetical protein